MAEPNPAKTRLRDSNNKTNSTCTRFEACREYHAGTNLEYTVPRANWERTLTAPRPYFDVPHRDRTMTALRPYHDRTAIVPQPHRNRTRRIPVVPFVNFSTADTVRTNLNIQVEQFGI